MMTPEERNRCWLREWRAGEVAGTDLSPDDPGLVSWFSGNAEGSRRTDVGKTWTRRHLCRIEAGQAMFGMDLGYASEGFRMLAVGVADTVLLELGRPKLLELARDPAHADRLSVLLEGWVANMSAAAVGHHLAPKESETLAPGQEISLGNQDAVHTPEGTVWVGIWRGASRFSAMDLPPVSGAAFSRVGPWRGLSRAAKHPGLL